MEWCQAIETNHGYNKYLTSEAILDDFGGFRDSTVASLVTAIAAAGSKYQNLCKKICEAADAPNAVNELKFDMDLYRDNSFRV